MNEREVFIAALQKESATERRAYLEATCGEDEGLRREVEALLAVHERAGSFLEHPFADPAATPFDPIQEKPGTVIGPYKLLEQIGEGSFGVVFMAEQQEPIRRKVALKVLKPGMDTRQVVARFEAERQALAIMDHPHIARVFDGGATATGRPYFVMELVEGAPITDFCDQIQMSVRQRLELFVSVCQAVQHAHQKGIIHRDLKSSNVLVTRHDGTPVVKVIDFGIAKATGQQLTDKTLFTNFQAMVGTPLYMSPEQAGMSGLDVDTRSDIYSLGVLLYELLTGTTPFDKERLKSVGYDEMRRIIREEEPPRPSTRLRTIGQASTTVSTQRQSDPRRRSQLIRGELDWIVMKALEKDRNRRYETASAFAADVQRYLHDEPVLACPPTFAYQLRKLAQRNKGRLVAAVLVLFLLALLGGVVGWTVLEQAKQQAAQRAALETDVGRDLDAARDFCRQDRMREASAVLDHAQELAARGKEGAWSLCPLYLGSRVFLLRRDVDMAPRLAAIRLEGAAIKDEHFDWEGSALRYTEAFRDYGLDLDRLEPGNVAARIEVSAIPEQLVAALDDWLLAVSGRNRERLLAVLARADDDPWRRQLRAAFVEGDLKTLRELARQANAPAQPPADAVLLGRALRDLGDPELAAEFLRLAQQRHPEDFWINEYLGSALGYLEAPEWDEAGRFLTAAVALRPKSPGAHLNLGMALYHNGQWDASIASFRKAIDLEPKYAAAHNGMGLALHQKGQLDQAIDCYKKALALDPKHYAAQSNLAEAERLAAEPPVIAQARSYIRLSQWKKAAEEYTKADFGVRPLQDDVFAYACLFLIQGDSKGYNSFCRDVIQRIAPTEAPREAYVLARTCAIAGKSPVDPAQAVRWAKQAVDRTPAARYFHALGLAQYRAGEFKQARDSFGKANVKSWFSSRLNWFGLALVHHRLGDPDKARGCLAKGIQWLERVGPPSPKRPAKLMSADWLEAQLLRREAEELLKIKRSP